MPQEFSKLEEFFYPSVGGEVNLSLQGFAGKAAEHYKQNSMRGAHVYRFACAGVEDSLVLTLNSYARPFLARLRIRQSTGQLESILPMLRGDIEARYEGLAVPLSSDFSPANATISDGILFVLKLAGKPGEDMAARLKTLRDAARKVILQGDVLLAEAAEYENKDPRGLLVQCKCVVRKHDAGWAFDYTVGTANLDPLPRSHLARAERVFQLASPHFHRVSVYRAKTNPFWREDEDHG